VPTISRDLTVGDTGDDVKALQQFLNNNGYTLTASGVGSPGNETSRFGALTRSALAKFQADNGISSTGYFGSKTRAFLSSLEDSGDSSSGTTSATLSAMIEAIKQQIANLQAQLAVMLASESAGPYIKSIVAYNGGDEDYRDIGDFITVTFGEVIDPTSIDEDLEAGDYITGVRYSDVAGISVVSSGKLTINGIATFDVGSVQGSGNFTSKAALSSSGKVLTITITSGSDVGINYEDFSSATQVGGTITNESGIEMQTDSNISNPLGSFGGTVEKNEEEGPSIVSIKVTNGGDDNYIDVGDYVTITFDKVIDGNSINKNLDTGEYVTGISYLDTGGLKVSSAGNIIIKGIASFDMGSVEESGNFTVKLGLDATGKILTITLTAGSDIEIGLEEFSSASQAGGYVEDESGYMMQYDSSIDDPTGTFGGDGTSSGGGPYITSIEVDNGGDGAHIDVGDSIMIYFSEDIDPESINPDFYYGDTVYDVSYSEVGGVSVSSSGKVTIRGIASFDMGSVEESGNFTVDLYLSSGGDILTITIASGNDISVTSESFGYASQAGGYIENWDGNEMDSDSNVCKPSGSFIEEGTGGPSISFIVINNGGDGDYIDVGDTIKIYFDREINPNSVNDDLYEGDYVYNISYYEVGGVSVSSSGKVTIRGIATFYVGSVAESGTFYVDMALSAGGDILTITICDGSAVEVISENFNSTTQTGGYIENWDGNEMRADSSINNPTGTFLE
jgi:peptidoglycan hydrolase-like protein with peptidoglycan-binding domain